MVTVGENCPYACRSSGLPSFPPLSGLDSIPGERIILVSRSANRILKIFSKLLESVPQTPTPLSHLLITLSRLLYSSLV